MEAKMWDRNLKSTAWMVAAGVSALIAVGMIVGLLTSVISA